MMKRGLALHRPVQSILVFRGGALGDVLLAGPALARLREAYPSARMTLVAKRGYAEVLEETLRPLALSELGSSRFSPLFLEGGALSDRLKDFVRSFDLVISWLGPADEPFARNLIAAGAKRLLAGRAFPEDGRALHAADHLMGTLDELGLPGRGEPLEVRLPAYNAQTCDKLLADCDVKVTEPLLAVHPGSGGLKKCWPTERFVSVARKVAELRGMQVLWLVGPAEVERAERFCTALPKSFVVMASVPMMMLAGVIQRARVYLGNDSGVTHLAAAVGTPTLALFGPTPPEVWAPRGEHVAVLHKRRLDSLKEEVVLERLTAMTEGL